MKKTLPTTSTIFALFVFSTLAFATTTVPLNSGYNHWWGTTYGTLPSPAGLPKQEDYWINVSTAGNFIPSFAITKHPAWANPGGLSTWVNFQNTANSIPGTNPSNPRYFIYRKCFCLLQGYSKPVIKFTIRADDSVAVWLNTITNPVINPSPGNFRPYCRLEWSDRKRI